MPIDSQLLSIPEFEEEEQEEELAEWEQPRMKILELLDGISSMALI